MATACCCVFNKFQRTAWRFNKVRFTQRTLLNLQRSEEHTSELQSHLNLVCRLLLEKKTEEHTSELQSHLNLVCRLLLEKKNVDTDSVNKELNTLSGIRVLLTSASWQCTYQCSPRQ